VAVGGTAIVAIACATTAADADAAADDDAGAAGAIATDAADAVTADAAATATTGAARAGAAAPPVGALIHAVMRHQKRRGQPATSQVLRVNVAYIVGKIRRS